MRRSDQPDLGNWQFRRLYTKLHRDQGSTERLLQSLGHEMAHFAVCQLNGQSIATQRRERMEHAGNFQVNSSTFVVLTHPFQEWEDWLRDFGVDVMEYTERIG